MGTFKKWSHAPFPSSATTVLGQHRQNATLSLSSLLSHCLTLSPERPIFDSLWFLFTVSADRRVSLEIVDRSRSQ